MKTGKPNPNWGKYRTQALDGVSPNWKHIQSSTMPHGAAQVTLNWVYKSQAMESEVKGPRYGIGPEGLHRHRETRCFEAEDRRFCLLWEPAWWQQVLSVPQVKPTWLIVKFWLLEPNPPQENRSFQMQTLGTTKTSQLTMSALILMHTLAEERRPW